VIEIDVLQVIELLQHEVARVVQQVGAGMGVHPLEEHLIGSAVEQVLARMDLVAEVDAMPVELVEDRGPAAGQLIEGLLHQPGGALRERVEIGPGQRAGEGRVRLEAQVLRGRGGPFQVLHRPFLPRLGVAAHLRNREPIAERIIGRVDGDELADDVAGQLGDLEAVLGDGGVHVVGIGLRGRGLLDIDEMRQPGGDLHALVAEVRGPGADIVERIERRFVAGELSQKDRRSLDRAHVVPPMTAIRPRLVYVPQFSSPTRGGADMSVAYLHCAVGTVKNAARVPEPRPALSPVMRRARPWFPRSGRCAGSRSGWRGARGRNCGWR